MWEQCQVPFEVSSDQGNSPARARSLAFFRRLCDVRVGQQEADLICRSLHRMGQQARVFVNHLGGNAAHGGGDHRLLLPQGLGDGEAEAFAQTLLDHHRGGALQSVDFEGSRWRQFEDEHIRIAAGGLAHFRQHLATLGVVGCAAPASTSWQSK